MMRNLWCVVMNARLERRDAFVRSPRFASRSAFGNRFGSMKKKLNIVPTTAVRRRVFPFRRRPRGVQDFEIEDNCAPRHLTAILKSRGRGGGSTDEKGQAAQSAARSSLDPVSSFSVWDSLRRPWNSRVCLASVASRRPFRGSTSQDRQKPSVAGASRGTSR